MPRLASLRVDDNRLEADPRRGQRPPPPPPLLLGMQKGRIAFHAPLKNVPVRAQALLAAALR